METGPATPSLPGANDVTVASDQPSSTAIATVRTDHAVATPTDTVAPPESYFKALRKVVHFKEMEMGELCTMNGLGACLKAMADAEVNPIVTEGMCTARIGACLRVALAFLYVPQPDCCEHRCGLVQDVR